MHLSAFTPCPELTERINSNYTFWVGEAEKEAEKEASKAMNGDTAESAEEEATAADSEEVEKATIAEEEVATEAGIKEAE